jgi:predicted nucleotidyltransferase
MLFKTLMEAYLDEEIKPDAEKLLDLKMNSPEIAEGQHFVRIDAYIDKTIAEIEEVVQALPDRHGQGWKELNELFVRLLD